MKRRIFIQGGSAAVATVLAGCGGGGGNATDLPLGTELAEGELDSQMLARRPWWQRPKATLEPTAAPTPAPTEAPTAEPAPTATPISPKSTGQMPVLTDNQLVTDAKWTDPSVLFENGGYTMWCGCGEGFTGNIRVFRLRSTDRINWTLSPSTPVLTRTDGAWDQSSVETPSVVFYGGEYHMFYTGYTGHWSESKNYRIGHAVSKDGISWTKDASFFTGPTDPYNETPSLDFRQWVCAEPGAVVVGNKLHLYFSAIGANAQVGTILQTIGVMVFDPAVGAWSEARMALMPDQSRYPRSSYYGFSTPAAVVRNGQVQLFYSVVQAEPWQQVGIGNAVSTDGMSNWSFNTLPLIGRDAEWRSTEALAPSAVVDSAGTHLWFGGNNGYNLGVGYMKIA